MQDKNYDYTERAKQFARTDFWKQVRRTVNGEDVSEDQINLIKQQILLLLHPKGKNDRLLDIGCGNGALTSRLHKSYEKIIGMDPSEYLIDIACNYFENSKLTFQVGDVGFLTQNISNYNFNHVLMYGVSSFVEDEELENFIKKFFNNGGEKLLIGNVRDISHMKTFYLDKNIEQPRNSVDTVMGKWRSLSFFESLADQNDVMISRSKMPIEFYAREYYFDVLYTRK